MMKWCKLLTVVILMGAISLTGCATNQEVGPRYSYTQRGIGIGALTGATIGLVAAGGSTGAAVAAGAVIGGITGGAIGNSMDRQAAELRTQLQGTGITVATQTNAIKLTMPEKVTFDFDKSTIKPSFFPALSKVVASLDKYPTTQIIIAGYTDSIGTQEYNLGLSQRRAKSVANYLAQHGVARNRMHTVGYGKTDPIATNKTAAGRAENRRVEMTIRSGVADK